MAIPEDAQVALDSGSLTIRRDPAMVRAPPPTGKRGRQPRMAVRSTRERRASCALPNTARRMTLRHKVSATVDTW